MADQLLSPFVGKLLDYIAVPVRRLCSYPLRYNANMEEFRSQLTGLETRRDDVNLRVEAAERKGEVILPSVEAWLKRIDVASDESKEFVEEEDGIGKRCFNGPLNLKVRYQRSRKAKKKALELDAIKKDGTFDEISAPAPPLPTWSVDNENEIDFESRRSIFNEIMEAIKDEGVGMIGIWGAGGIGKTTLVKRVAKYAKDEGLFEVVAMAVVSQNLSVKAIQGQIADDIGLELMREDESGLAGQLRQRLLARKKILIILDDIWASIDLNDVGIPCGSQHKDCTIILTTRKRDVCEEMGTRKIFKIDLLSENEALDLFLLMSGVDDRLSEKGSLAQSLSKECGGLPICIAIVARGLLNKPEVSWENMLNRLRNSVPDERVCDIIKISYDHLIKREEKMFFLLCAFFPEDHEIPIQVLFEYGLGLNLFERVDNLDEAAVRAWNLASRLKSQCLLLDIGGEMFVKMDDVVREVALDIAAEGKHEILVPRKTAILLESDDVEKLPNALECPNLHIFMMDCPHRDSLHGNFFTGMKNLIVLDLWRMKFLQLPQSFAALENLRTLRLSFCHLGDVSAIGKLQNLVSLSFYSSSIQVLPKELGELSNLRFLDLSKIRILKVITVGVIQNLSRLEVLRVGRIVLPSSAEQVCHPVNAILSELIHLPRLMILQICIPDASMLPDDMQLFKTLTKFKVSIGKGDLETTHLNSQILKLNHLSGHVLSKSGIKILMKKAQYLKLKDISGIYLALPSPLGGYGSLKKLIVKQCKDINYVLDVSESEYELETPSLQVLHLINLPLLKEISRGKFPSFIVSKMEHLKLHELPSLVRLWPFQAESNLSTMEVASCNELEYVFDYSNAKSILKLKKLKVGKCKNLQAICLIVEQDDAIVFPQLNHLELLKLQNLTSFSSKFTLESTLFGNQVILLALKTLYINNLEKLEKIWHIHAPVEPFFQLKALKLRQCSKLLVVFPPQATSGLQNLEELCIENCDKLETLFESNGVPLTISDEMIIFPRLLTLKLVNLPKFTGILSTTSQNISQAMDQLLLTFFPKLKKLELEAIGRLSSTADPLHVINELEALEELVIKDNNAKTLPQVIANGKTLPQVVAILPKLRKLELGFIHEPIEWCESLNQCEGFQSLTSLNLFSCNGVKSLLRPSTFSFLVQLQELYVEQCETMESIIGEMNEEQNCNKSIEFSKLHTLRLLHLPDLTSFYNGECALKFPCLDDLLIEYCPKLRTLASMASKTSKPSSPNLVAEALFGQQVSFGRLSELKLSLLESIEEIWCGDHPATNVGQLTSLHVEYCDKLLKLFPSSLLGGLHNLSRLEVHSCRLLEHVFAVEDDSPLLSNLIWVELDALPEMKQLWWNKNTHESFGLPNLLCLRIDTCPSVQFIFDPSVGNRMEKLTSIEVENCSSMVEIVAEKPGKKIEFPDLHVLKLVNLPCFKVKQDAGFQPVMLTEVVVECCVNLKESCNVKVEDELVGSVRYFESFVE